MSHRRVIDIHPDSTSHRSSKEKLEGLLSLIENGLSRSDTVVLRFVGSLPKQKRRDIQFPARNSNESMQFAICLKVLRLLIENLNKGTISTRRDLYYQDVSLFQSQSKVDSAIEVLSRSLGYSQHEIGTIASQKGLFQGRVRIVLQSGDSHEIGCVKKSTLIPYLTTCVRIDVIDEIDYILVVEKDAVFSNLLDSEHRRIVVTAKGFPDELTKRFVSMLSRSVPDVPVFGIADLDPYGFNILKHYKTGGNFVADAGFSIKKREVYKCPRISVPGLTILDFINDDTVCQNMSLRDFSQSKSLIEKWTAENGETPVEWITELQRGMFFYKKAEIDSISSPGSDSVKNLMEVYVRSKIESYFRRRLKPLQM